MSHPASSLAVPAAATARAGAGTRGQVRGTPPRPRRPRNVLPWALGGSVLLHLLFLALSPAFLRIGPPPGEAEGEHALARPEMRALEIAPARPLTQEAPAARAPAPPTERVAIPVPAAAPTPLPPGETRAAPAPGGTPPALNLGPRDPRLWIAPRQIPPPAAPTEHEAYMSHLRARLQVGNDSVGIGAPNLDWTTTDAQGRRWGLSPAGIHLGGVTIPRELVPVPMTSSEREAEARERQRQREEIQRDEEARERRRIRDERERVPRRDSGEG